MAGFPEPTILHPVLQRDGNVHQGTVFLKAAIRHPRFEVGDYTYASAHEPVDSWASHLAPYLYDFSPEKLVIGMFCQIANGVKFITASANHRMDGFSTYPFAIFHGRTVNAPSLPGPGKDTLIGNDVWLGEGVRVLPGANIGNGCIIGAGSVVAGTIPSYSMVAGNPARIVRPRFDAALIAVLERVAWWDWPIDVIVGEEAAICGGDIDRLIDISRAQGR